MSDGRASTSTFKAGHILLSWRRLEVQHIAADLLRQPAAIGMLATLSAGVFFVLLWAFKHEPQSELSRFALETAGSAFALALMARVAEAVQARGPLQGVFLPLVATPKRRIAYQLLEAAILWLAVLVCATLALVSVAPGRLVGLLAAAAVGFGLASFLAVLRRGQTNHRSGEASKARLKARSLRGPLLATRLQWRRRVGPMPAWAGSVALGLTTMVAAALAYRNNVNPGFGEAVLVVGALAGGAVSGRIDTQLVRFIGHEPLPLARIVAAFALPTPVAVALATGAGALVIGLGPTIAFSAGLGTAGLLATYLSLTVIHALAGRPRFASFAASVDLTICIVFVATYTPLLWVWAPARVLALITQARRRRWLDR